MSVCTNKRISLLLLAWESVICLCLRLLDNNVASFQVFGSKIQSAFILIWFLKQSIAGRLISCAIQSLALVFSCERGV